MKWFSSHKLNEKKCVKKGHNFYKTKEWIIFVTTLLFLTLFLKKFRDLMIYPPERKEFIDYLMPKPSLVEDSRSI